MVSLLIFDKEAALERVGFDRELLCELVAMFKSDYKNYLSQIKEAILSNNIVQAKDAAHSFKSSLGNIGAMIAFDQAHKIELLAKNGDLSNGLDHHQKLEDEVTKFFSEFESFKETSD